MSITTTENDGTLAKEGLEVFYVAQLTTVS